MPVVPLGPLMALSPTTAVSLAASVSLMSCTKFHTSGKSPFDINGLLLIHLYTIYVVLMKFSVCSHGMNGLVSNMLNGKSH